jgi:hypothetical protein
VSLCVFSLHPSSSKSFISSKKKGEQFATPVVLEKNDRLALEK